jgi:mannose-6-phosphate isomerase-like protein (cupin superfamily)
MTDRERQRRLDLLAMQFVNALEVGDFETIDRLWTISATDTELEAVFLETTGELARMYEAWAAAPVAGAVKRNPLWAVSTGGIRGNRNLQPEEKPMDQKQNLSRRGMIAAAAADAFGPILVRHESEVPETESSCGFEKGLCGIIDGGAARACSMALTNVVAHYHKRTTEIYYVLDGQGVVQLNGEAHQVRKGSFMHIPPGVVHSFTGQAKVLIIGVPAISTDDDMFYPASPESGNAHTA